MKTAAVADKPKAGVLKLLLIGFVAGLFPVAGFLFGYILGLIAGAVAGLMIFISLTRETPGTAFKPHNSWQQQAETNRNHYWATQNNQQYWQERDDWDNFCRRNDHGRYSD